MGKEQVKALLEDANKGSQHVAVLHVAFMGLCAYLLTTAFSTTDLNLLVGKGVKLPIVDVEVPIAPFYAAAPYLVLLVHFNLLVQLQLLARKIFVFDDLAVKISEDDTSALDALRGQLHIFPFTYFLVWPQRTMVSVTLGLMVSVSLVYLPLATMFALQIKALAYQHQYVTWAQRVAIWTDFTLIAAMWPLIVIRHDRYRAWWEELLKYCLNNRAMRIAGVLFVLGLALVFWSESKELFWTGVIVCIAFPWIGQVLLRRSTSLSRSCDKGRVVITLIAAGLAFIIFVHLQFHVLLLALLVLMSIALFWYSDAPDRSLPLLSAAPLALLLPLGLIVDGERLESGLTSLGPRTGATYVSGTFFEHARRLDLNGQVTNSKGGKTETAGLNLSNRQLRKAQLEGAHLVSASLRSARLQGANLVGGNLMCADLTGALLKGADLAGANLQCARLYRADLAGANLSGARLQAASLESANLEGADLQGANLHFADLKGTNFGLASLRKASICSASASAIKIELSSFVDVRDIKPDSPTAGDRAELRRKIYEQAISTRSRDAALARVDDISSCQRPMFRSCLVKLAERHVDCERAVDPDSMSSKLFMGILGSYLAAMACNSDDFARGILHQTNYPDRLQSSRHGLREMLDMELKSGASCHGLSGLTEYEKRVLEGSMASRMPKIEFRGHGRDPSASKR